MSETTNNPEVNQENPENIDELTPEKEKEILMSRARLMGLKVSNNIGLDTLRERVNDAQEGKLVNEQGNDEKTEVEANPLVGNSVNSKGKTKTLRQYMRDTQMKLIRVRITCMNPKKADLQGEVFTTANEHLGTVRKFVPYGEVTEEGWHVPYCIYKQLINKKFCQTRSVKDPRTKQERVEYTMVKEFSVEVLPPLTKEQLKELATNQAAAGSFN